MISVKQFIGAAVASILIAHLSLYADVPVCGNNNPGGPGNPPCPSGQCPDPPQSCPVGGPNPFHVGTGNAYREIADLEVWGGVGEHQLAFKRYGISRYIGSLKWFGEGHTWRHSYQWELVSDGTRALKVYKPDGSQWRYVLTGGQWTRLAATPDRLTQNGNNFFLQTADGYRYRFHTFTDANNQVYYLLVDFTDSAGNLYTLTYDESRRLVQVTEPAGRYLRIAYSNIPVNQNAFTRLGTITTHPASGQWTEIAVSNPSTFRYLRYFSSQPSSNETFCNIAEMEFYDTAGNKVTGTPFGTSPPYAPGSEFDKATDGSVDTFFQYQWPHFGFTGIDLGAGNEKAISKIRFYPRPGHENDMVSPGRAGYPTGCRFEGSNVAPITETVIARVDSSDGRFVTYNYGTVPDSVLTHDWLTLQSVQYGDGSAATYAYTMYWAGQPPLLSEANDSRYIGSATRVKYSYWESSYVYGAVHQERNGVTEVAMATLERASAGTNQVVYANGKVNTIANSAVGVTANADTLGRTWSFAYSTSGFRSSDTDPLNRQTTYTRTAAGNLLSKTHPDGSVESWTRDSLDLPLTYTLSGPGITSRTTQWTRDALHRVTRIDYPDQSYETFTYNGYGQVTGHRMRNGVWKAWFTMHAASRPVTRIP